MLNKYKNGLTSLLNKTVNFENDIGWGQFILKVMTQMLLLI